MNAAQNSDSRSLDKYIVRFPNGLRSEIKAAAEANGRSLNAEIIHRIANFAEGNMPSDDTVPVSKNATLTIRLTSEIRQKLDALAVRGPYKISITSIVERGIELAAQELAALSTKGDA